MPRISNPVRSAAANGAVDYIDVGSGDAELQLRTGNAPTNITDAAAGTLLATFELPAPAFGDATNGVATANAITPTVGLTGGTVGHYRVINRNGDPVLDADYATGGLTLNTTSISNGVDVEITSWTVTMPAGSV